jgi:hypothetical protein
VRNVGLEVFRDRYTPAREVGGKDVVDTRLYLKVLRVCVGEEPRWFYLYPIITEELKRMKT